MSCHSPRMSINIFIDISGAATVFNWGVYSIKGQLPVLVHSFRTKQLIYNSRPGHESATGDERKAFTWSSPTVSVGMPDLACHRHQCAHKQTSCPRRWVCDSLWHGSSTWVRYSWATASVKDRRPCFSGHLVSPRLVVRLVCSPTFCCDLRLKIRPTHENYV